MKRAVVVTGGTKGLGREIALAFGRAGWNVAALYASDEKAAEELRAALDGIEARARVLRHDVTVAAEADRPAWSAPEIRDAERLVLIHNACAPFSPAPMHQLRWEDFQAGMDVAVKGAWLCSQALIKPMLKQGGGRIVNVLSSAVEGMPPKGFAAYATAKHALRGLTLAQAAEYAPRGVRVFSVSPGFMDTPLTQKWDERLRDAIRSGARITNPANAASRILELAETDDLPGRGEDYAV